jgi:hypothetical protein
VCMSVQLCGPIRRYFYYVEEEVESHTDSAASVISIQCTLSTCCSMCVHRSVCVRTV